MSFGEAIQTVFRKYAEFTGRATRAEFWWWALFNVLVASALSLFNVIPIGNNAYLGSLLSGLWGIAVLLPSLAVAVRRMRDAGSAGATCSLSWSRSQGSSWSSSTGHSPRRRRCRRRPPRTPSLLIRRYRCGIQPRSDESACAGRRLPAVQVSPPRPRIVRPDGSQRGSQRVHVEPMLAKEVATVG
jgi:hypothetical protein